MKLFAILLLASVASVAPAASDVAPPASALGDLPTYRYPLSGGDKLRVIVFGAANLGGDYVISGEGTIALPLIGTVEARGLTSTELSARIAAKLADGYVKQPRVAVEVLSTRPFYILGEVNKPGEYPFVNGLTVAAAVAQAGGYTYRAKTHRVLIQHAGDASAVRITVRDDTRVAPGDTVRVPERWF